MEMPLKITAFLAGILTVIGGAAPASPSQDPYRTEYIGIYGIVEKVAFEPNEESPQRIRIWGAFTVPAPMSSFQRMPVQRGFLYFAMVPAIEAAMRKEWAEIRAVAGTGQGIGFGRYWVNGDGPNGNPHTALNVQVHSDSEVAAPEPYPAGLSSGVVRMDKHENEPGILVQLQEVLRSR